MSIQRVNHGGRFEAKYVVSKEISRSILEFVAPHLEPDPYMKGGSYWVKTLYFDTAGLSHYREVLEGESVRKKFRLRTYDSENPFFFEVKHKNIRTVRKERAKADYEECRRMIVGQAADSPVAPLQNYRMDFLKEHYQETVTVAYQRVALVHPHIPKLRVTLDHNIRCGKKDLLFREPEGTDLRVLPPQLAVLELKFENKLPVFLTELVRHFELEVYKYSKYCQSMDRLYFNKEINPVRRA